MSTEEIAVELAWSLDTAVLDDYKDEQNRTFIFEVMGSNLWWSLSRGEQVVMRVAAEIYNGSGQALVYDLLTRLDDERFDQCIAALRAARGRP